MAVPSVVNVVPTRGPTAGRTMVQVFGDNFQLPPPPPDVIPVPDPGPGVEVLFGTEPGTNVRVLKSNRLLVDSPISPIDAVRVRMKGTPALTFADANPDTIARDVGDWRADGFRAGMRIRVFGSTSNDNDSATEYLIASPVTALVLTLDAAVSLVAEGPTSSVRVRAAAYGEGRVDIVVRNIDSVGDPIPGETVTIVDGYSFERVQLATASDLQRVCRTLLREVRRQVIANASLSDSVDYDADHEDLVDVVSLAELPGIALLGPDTPENRFYSLNARQEIVLPDGTILVRRVPHTVDLEFDVLGISDRKTEHLNLQALWMQFVDRNPFLFVARDPDDPTKGKVKYELEQPLGAGPLVRREPNRSDIRVFTASIVIRGFDLEDLAGFTDEKAVDLTAEVEDVPGSGIGTPAAVALGGTGSQRGATQTGVSFAVGPSPGTNNPAVESPFPGGDC